MPTTSNFGWTTPADTDLVKDGAAAIRTLGNGIDTSFVDLKGGTSGQILSKNSNTDLDFVWIANDQGDITAVTAGTGISGGGTSGAVTITNSMATEITAKGDLIVGTGNAAFDNLPAGTNGHILTADSTVSPTGLKWAAPAAAAFKGCRLTFSSGVTVANGTNVTVNWDVETFDTDAFHSTSSNTSRITIPSGLGGKYLYCVKGLFENQAAGLSIIRLYKNGTQVLTVDMYKPSGAYTTTAFSDIIELVATDYLEIVWYQNTGSSGTLQAGQSTSFGVQFLGA